MSPNPALIMRSFFDQQAELGMPGYILSSAELRHDILKKTVQRVTIPQRVRPVATVAAVPFKPVIAAPAARTTAVSPLSRLKRIGPAASPTTQPLSTQPVKPVNPRINTPNRLALKALFDEAKSCSLCGCALARIKYAFGSGNADAPLVIIGDAPDAQSSSAGLPFTGATAQTIDNLLAAAGINKERDCFFTNVLKCPPLKEQAPSHQELRACEPLLIRQLAIINPRLILCIGQSAAHLLLNTTASITDLRTAQHRWKTAVVLVTWPPAALCAGTAPADQARADMAACAALLNDLQKEQQS